MFCIIEYPTWMVCRHINLIKKVNPKHKETSWITHGTQALTNTTISYEQTKTYPDGNYGNKSQKTKICCPTDILKKIVGRCGIVVLPRDLRILGGIKDVVFLKPMEYMKISVSSKTNFGSKTNSARLIFAGLYHFS